MGPEGIFICRTKYFLHKNENKRLNEYLKMYFHFGNSLRFVTKEGFTQHWNLLFPEASCKDHGTVMIKAFYNGSVATFSSRFWGIWCGGHRSNTVALWKKTTLAISWPKNRTMVLCHWVRKPVCHLLRAPEWSSACSAAVFSTSPHCYLMYFEKSP